MADKKFVQSVIKALNIIELLDKHKELGVTEIATALGIDKSTAFRLLSTLKEKRFISNNPRTQKYSNSSKLFAIGQEVLRNHNLNTETGLELRKLSERIGETVNLAIPDGLEVLYVDRHETDDFIKLAATIGQRRPMYCTAVGKAILAHYPASFIETLCETVPLEAFTPYTITDKDKLLEDLAQIRVLGYSVDNQEHHIGIRCVGIPILNRAGTPMAAVSVSVPQFRYDQDLTKFDQCVQALLAASAPITEAFVGM